MERSSSKLIGQTFARNFRVVGKIGAGAFGEIFSCINKQNQEEYAMKVESCDTQFPQIAFEGKLYLYLHSNSEGREEKGIPKLHYYGVDNGYNILIIEKLGQSLESLFNQHKKKFSIKTVTMIADQMIQRIEFLHNKSFIHRDIKPDNFLMGPAGKKEHQLYMQRKILIPILLNTFNYMQFQSSHIIDFGLSKRCISKEGKHIPYKSGKSLTGTARYASINTHIGIEQSRRDDMESIGYVLIYFLRGILPWQNLQAQNKNDKYKKIMEKKMQVTTEQLCKGLPSEFAKYLNYCKNLRFEDKPDYIYCRSLFKEILENYKLEYDFNYDWTQFHLKKSLIRKEQEDAINIQININKDDKKDQQKDQNNKEQLKNTSIYMRNTQTKSKPFYIKQQANLNETQQQQQTSTEKRHLLSYDNTPENNNGNEFRNTKNLNNPQLKNNYTTVRTNTQNSLLNNNIILNLKDRKLNSLLQTSGQPLQLTNNHNTLNHLHSHYNRGLPLPKIIQHRNPKKY